MPTMTTLMHSSSQHSQFESQPLSQHAMSEASQQSFGRGAHLGAMAAMARRNGSQDSDERGNASERQEMHDDEEDVFSPVLLEVHPTSCSSFLPLPAPTPSSVIQ